MGSTSLQINEATWNVSFLGEQVLVLSPQDGEVELSEIHQLFRLLEKAALVDVTDIIPAYDSIAITYNRFLRNEQAEAVALSKALQEVPVREFDSEVFDVPVCYEMGLDWTEVEDHLSLSRDEIIQKHSSGEYTVAMMGFLPGFLYLSGLNKALACQRKEDPRTKIPAGSVGIGGEQTGIYSLESPGGWQIIGRTPNQYFDVRKDPPLQIRPGDKVRFTPISKQQFNELKP